jgi:hypothetical protein
MDKDRSEVLDVSDSDDDDESLLATSCRWKKTGDGSCYIMLLIMDTLTVLGS